MRKLPLLLLMFLCMPNVPMAQVATQDLPLTNAATFVSETHIIITARLADDASVTEYGAELSARFGAAVDAIWPLATVDVICFVLRVPAGADLDAIQAELLAQPEVIQAYPIQAFDTLATVAYADDLVPIQNSLRWMRAFEAHGLATGRGCQGRGHRYGRVRRP